MTPTQLSKFLSLILRHEPEKIGLTMDKQGWAEISDLLVKSAQHNVVFDRDALQAVVDNSDKQRFAISDDGLKIRAQQGHSSKQVDLDFVPQTPPDVLYHGTASRFIASIREHGLQPQTRHHVHLSSDMVTATAVGARHGKVVVLSINAAQMHAAGHEFYLSGNGVWLCQHVPLEYLGFDAEE